MDRHFAEWKLELERLWSARAPDYGEAVRIAAHIASAAPDGLLRHAAIQALPILRSAADDDADHATHLAARRRLGIMRQELLAFVNPRFGKRESQPKLLSSVERYRQMLGLPADGSLSAPEIHQAWKRAAKAAHPDAGGSDGEFQALSAARDALIRDVRLVRGA